MKIAVNLASEPFRRDRPLIVGSIAVGIMLAGLCGVLLYLAGAEHSRLAEARQASARLENSLHSLSQQEAKLEAVLRQPHNAEVLERSVFINELLTRKGLSWTHIFEDLETVTPPNVRVITVRPQINANSRDLMLDLVVGAQSSDPLNSFVTELERSQVFSLPNVHSSQPPSETDPLFKYRISVNYAQKL